MANLRFKPIVPLPRARWLSLNNMHSLLLLSEQLRRFQFSPPDLSPSAPSLISRVLGFNEPLPNMPSPEIRFSGLI